MGRVDNFKRRLILILMLGLLLIDNSIYASNGFPDMPNDWSRDALEFAVSEGILNGIDGRIEAYKNLTRSEVVAIMSRTLNLENAKKTYKFKDVSKSNWYYKDLQKVVDAGIMKGTGDKFDPDRTISREEAFTVLNRAYKYSPKKSGLEHEDANKISKWAYKDILSLESNGIIQGYNNRMNPQGKITRAEFAQTIYNISKLNEDLNDKDTEVDIDNEVDIGTNLENKDEHFLYNELYRSLANFNANLKIDMDRYNKDYSLDEFKKDFMEDRIVSRVILENPDIDYGYNGHNIKYTYSNGKIKNIDIKFYYTWKHVGSQDFKNPKYRLSREKMISNKKAVDKMSDEIIKSIIKPGMSDFEKELAIHDYIVKNAEYDSENANKGYRNNHTAYGVLIQGKGVCDSYAKAFYILSKKAGLDVLYVRGEATNSYGKQNHAWNMVKLDGDWYHVDPTWDDPIFVNGNKPLDYVSYKYFNLTDDEIFKSHKIDESLVKYPKANGVKYKYNG